MELSDQGSRLTLIASIMCIIRACLYICGMLTGDRVAGQSCEHGLGEQREPWNPGTPGELNPSVGAGS